MARSRMDVAAADFKSEAETLHNRFLAISTDSACTGCQSAGFGEAILVAWLQAEWGRFTRSLIVASVLGTRRRRGNPVKAIAGVRSPADAEKVVKSAAAYTAKKHGTGHPVWHKPSFAIEVGSLIGLQNQPKLEVVLGATLVPWQITAFRNYLVHRDADTRKKYEVLQGKLGMHDMEPETLLHQFQKPGLTVFTSWVRELQRIADDSTR